MNRASPPDGLNAARRAQRSSLGISLAGGTAEERAVVREALAALTDIKMEVGEVSSAGQAPAQTDAVRVLLFILDDDPELWDQELQPWIEQGGWHQVTALVRRRTPDAVRVALQAGAAEVLFMPPDAVDLTRLLLKISGSQLDGVRPVGKAAYALVSVSGGVGVSSLAVAMGLAMSRLTGRRVALMDLALQADSLAAILDLKTTHSIGELADPTAAVDSLRLESAISKHPSGLYLLAAPARIEDGEMVSPGTVEASVGVMLQLFDFVLIDCGHHISEASVSAWERAGNVFYVLDQSVTAVHATHRFLDLFQRLKLRHVGLDLLLNRYRPEHAISLDAVQQALHRPIAFCIPHDASAAAAVETEGDGPLTLAPSSPMPLAVSRLVEALLGIEAASNGRARSGVFSRLRGALGH